MKRALLVQRPVPSFRWPFVDATVPLAAAYLASWARANAPGWRVEILPWEEADVLGDEALFRAILSRSPDLVGFSLYLWNLDRSLYLIRRLRAAGVPVTAGGPEVSPDNPWIPGPDIGWTPILGEGEEAFSCLLRGPAGAVASEGAPVDLSRLPSPYLGGLLAPWPDGSVWIETVRGCPHRCSYCNYGKRFAGPRPFPSGWLADHLDWARRVGAREVYLMDPSFNVRKDWADVVATLEEHRGLALHTELVADRLRPGDGERLARAGLASCEVGLQTIHSDILAGVGRRWDRRRWVRGVRELAGAGVSVAVGLIAGLPGDSPERFAQTLEFVLREVPGAEIQLFPLALLPSTELRDRAAALGIEALGRPPYTVTRTPGFTSEALAEVFGRFEEATGLELDPLGTPRLTGPWEGAGEGPYLSGVRLDAEKLAASGDLWIGEVVRRAAVHLTVWFQGWSDVVPAQVARLVSGLPHGVLTVVLEDGAGWSCSRLSRLLAAGTGEHYLDRYLGHLYGYGSRLVPRLVVLADPGDPCATSEWAADVRARAELVWTVEARPGWGDRVRGLASEGETAFVRGDPSPGELPALAENLGTDAVGVVFSSEAAQTEWEQLLGVAGFRVPERRVAFP